MTIITVSISIDFPIGQLGSVLAALPAHWPRPSVVDAGDDYVFMELTLDASPISPNGDAPVDDKPAAPPAGVDDVPQVGSGVTDVSPDAVLAWFRERTHGTTAEVAAAFDTTIEDMRGVLSILRERRAITSAGVKGLKASTAHTLLRPVDHQAARERAAEAL